MVPAEILRKGDTLLGFLKGSSWRRAMFAFVLCGGFNVWTMFSSLILAGASAHWLSINVFVCLLCMQYLFRWSWWKSALSCSGRGSLSERVTDSALGRLCILHILHGLGPGVLDPQNPEPSSLPSFNLHSMPPLRCLSSPTSSETLASPSSQPSCPNSCTWAVTFQNRKQQRIRFHVHACKENKNSLLFSMIIFVFCKIIYFCVCRKKISQAFLFLPGVNKMMKN